MTRRVLTWFLVGWVGLVCPSLCAGTGVSTKLDAPQQHCCSEGDSEHESPDSPCEPLKDPCFCSGHAVQLSKSDSLAEIDPPTLDSSFAAPIMLIGPRVRFVAIETFCVIQSPGENLILPLLI